MEFVDPEQTNLNDDFEESLKHDGIEIHEGEEEATEGVGATFKGRTTAPSTDNPYYLKKGMGGYNPCILISGNSCLPNCVGFAWGAWHEEVGKTDGDSRLPTCNAEDWYEVAKSNGLEVGKTPRLGAVIVWKSGNLWNGADGCGHVGVVEKIEDGKLLIANSNYGGTRFFTFWLASPYSITGQTFLGFVYNPYITGEWKKNSKGWWYVNPDGTYPKNKWQKIDGVWYHFDSKGYMQTGWIKLKSKWYYLGTDGKMQTGWIPWKSHWYYCGTDGAMYTGEHKVKAVFDKNGALIKGE